MPYIWTTDKSLGSVIKSVNDTYYLVSETVADVAEHTDYQKYFWNYEILAIETVDNIDYILLQNCSEEKWNSLHARMIELAHKPPQKEKHTNRNVIISTLKNPPIFCSL